MCEIDIYHMSFIISVNKQSFIEIMTCILVTLTCRQRRLQNALKWPHSSLFIVFVHRFVIVSMGARGPL